MGNRAVLTFTQSAKAPAIYLHWNGGRASIDGFLAAARALQIDAPTDSERMDSLAEMMARFFGCNVGHTVYREPYGRADRDNGDNGVYLLSRDWHIVGRLHEPKTEERNEPKTQAIATACVAHCALL